MSALSLSAWAESASAEAVSTEPTVSLVFGARNLKIRTVLDEKNLEIITDDQKNTFVQIQGSVDSTFVKDEWGMVVNSERIVPDAQGGIKLRVPVGQTPSTVGSPSTQVQLMIIGPYGEIEVQKFEVFYSVPVVEVKPEEKEPDLDSEWNSQSLYRYNAGLATTFSSYSDKNVSSKTQMGIVLKSGIIRRLKETPWSFGFSFYFNFLPIFHSQPKFDAARFYGLNLRAGYHLDSPIAGFDSTVSVGWYLWGMLVSSKNYGLSSVFGPQFFLSGRRQLPNTHWLSTYIKYAPLVENAGLPNPLNHELAVGGSYNLLCDWGFCPVNLTLDLSELNATFSTKRYISVYTMSVGLSKDF